MLFAFSNALFDSTEKGVEETFSSSFTGDLIIRPVSNLPLSLFGDETPLTGNLTKIQNIIPFEKVFDAVQSNDFISDCIPQISCSALAENNKKRLPVFLFGLDFDKYKKMMSSINLKEGRAFTPEEQACILQSKMAEELKVSLGDKIQFVTSDGVSLKIRSLTVTGIYDYNFTHSSLEKIVIASPLSVRELSGSDTSYSDYDFSEDLESLLSSDLNEDDFFFEDDMSFFEVSVNEKNELKSQDTFNSYWNFIICKSEDSKKAAFQLNETFKENDWPVQAVLWRQAAGSTALYIHWLRIIFNAGIFIILFAGLIVVDNTLVIHVINKSQETGTLRAIGASSFFVAFECLLENLILSIFSAFTGIILSFVLCRIVKSCNIVFTNEFLIQLFGSKPLDFSVSFFNCLSVFLLCLFIAVIAWILPVKNILSVEPANAISGAK